MTISPNASVYSGLCFCEGKGCDVSRKSSSRLLNWSKEGAVLRGMLVSSWRGFNRQDICPKDKFQKAQLSWLKKTSGRGCLLGRQLDFVTQDPGFFIFIIWGFIRPFSCRDIVYFGHTSLRLYFSLPPSRLFPLSLRQFCFSFPIISICMILCIYTAWDYRIISFSFGSSLPNVVMLGLLCSDSDLLYIQVLLSSLAWSSALPYSHLKALTSTYLLAVNIILALMSPKYAFLCPLGYCIPPPIPISMWHLIGHSTWTLGSFFKMIHQVFPVLVMPTPSFLCIAPNLESPKTSFFFHINLSSNPWVQNRIFFSKCYHCPSSQSHNHLEPRLF